MIKTLFNYIISETYIDNSIWLHATLSLLYVFRGDHWLLSLSSFVVLLFVYFHLLNKYDAHLTGSEFVVLFLLLLYKFIFIL